MKIVALLPIKFMSVRVPGKNFRNFCGKPLFRWMLDNLLELDEVSEVVINTDARTQLLEQGLEKSERVLIRDRSPELCGNEVSMNLVLQDDIAAVAADLYLMTHVTNPLLSPNTIRRALDKMAVDREAGADSLFTVNRVQSRFYRADGSSINHDPTELIPTQDLEPWFEENSNLYLFTADSFLATGARIGQRPTMMETPFFESVDIDEPQDWEYAELAASYLAKLESNES